MTDPTNRPPLWEVMDAARFLALHKGCNNGVAVAAELRAIADEIPEVLYGAGGVRRWLREEADRAEAGG